MTGPNSAESVPPLSARLGARTEVDRVALLLINAWEKAEGTPVTASYVATFADMARAVIADRATPPPLGPVRVSMQTRHTPPVARVECVGGWCGPWQDLGSGEECVDCGKTRPTTPGGQA